MQAWLAVIFVVVICIFAAIYSAKRRKELMAWAHSKGLSYDRHKRYNMENRFAAFKCFRRGRSRYAYNIMEGNWKERPIAAFDYHYRTGSGKNSHDYTFSAVVIETALPLKPLHIRTENLADKLADFVGVSDLEFESAEFNRIFYVKSPDRRWAYDVLHTRTMQFLLDSPRFIIQFAPCHVIAYRSTKFSTQEFEQAAETVSGILDRLPAYLIKQLKEETSI